VEAAGIARRVHDLTLHDRQAAPPHGMLRAVAAQCCAPWRALLQRVLAAGNCSGQLQRAIARHRTARCELWQATGAARAR
jgi:hypothetical protein